MALSSGVQVAQSADASSAAEPGRFGRYEILRKLATGGMGEVYLARSVGIAGFQKYVVVKRILPHLLEHPHFVEALVREAKLVVNLDHPNIVQVLDLGVEGHDYFMTMEFVQGYNLAAIAHYGSQKGVIIPANACVAVGLGVLAGLEYAHGLRGVDGERQNVIHRDVSPQNVMISRDGRVKLTDFGIAKVLNEAEGELTQTLKGKFRYMAPEAVDGGRLDQRYDLFACGILLFESLCRRHLFGGRSDVEILRQVRAAKVPSIERYHAGVPMALVEVVRKALQKDPSHRFQSALEFSDALRQAIHPVSESDVAAELRDFVLDVYERPDFPINKPKLPNLKGAGLEATRSLVLHSHLADQTIASGNQVAKPISDTAAPARSQNTWSLLVVALASVIVSVAVGFILLRDSSKKDPAVIVVKPKASPAVTSTAFSDGDADTPGGDPAEQADAGLQRSGRVSQQVDDHRNRRRIKRPRVITFTRKVGRRVFKRHRAAITRCFDRHIAANAPDVTLRVVSEIRSDGTVSRVRLDPAAQSTSPLGQCILAVARRIRYPRHDQPMITFLQPLTVRRSR